MVKQTIESEWKDLLDTIDLCSKMKEVLLIQINYGDLDPLTASDGVPDK